MERTQCFIETFKFFLGLLYVLYVLVDTVHAFINVSLNEEPSCIQIERRMLVQIKELLIA